MKTSRRQSQSGPGPAFAHVRGLADRLGKSKSWVDKVERGVRTLDRFSVIQDLAAVLRTDPVVLLGRDAAARSPLLGQVASTGCERPWRGTSSPRPTSTARPRYPSPS